MEFTPNQRSKIGRGNFFEVFSRLTIDRSFVLRIFWSTIWQLFLLPFKKRPQKGIFLPIFFTNANEWYLLMRSDIEKKLRILRCGIFRSVWRRIGHHHKYRFIGFLFFGITKKSYGVIGDQVWKIVFGIVPSMLDFLAVTVDCVIIKPRISY